MAFVYLLASKPNGTLYCGSTTDLLRRIWEHKNKFVRGFTADYGVDKLVWFEAHELIIAARMRERQIKEWKRDWKIALIEQAIRTGSIFIRRYHPSTAPVAQMGPGLRRDKEFWGAATRRVPGCRRDNEFFGASIPI